MSRWISPREFSEAEGTGPGSRRDWWTLADPEGNEVDVATWMDH